MSLGRKQQRKLLANLLRPLQWFIGRHRKPTLIWLARDQIQRVTAKVNW
jgi:hypothetical protein